MLIANIFIISVIAILCVPIYILFVLFGYIYCKQNNAYGLILLILTLNIIGLLFGCIILYNNNHSKIDYKFKKIKWLNKYTIDEKIKNINPTPLQNPTKKV